MNRSIPVLLFAVGLTGTAQAEFNYNFVNASYGQVDFDDLDVDGDGIGIGVSLAVAESFHVFAGVEQVDLDLNINADITDWSAGIGFNTPLSPVMDVVAQLSYQRIEIGVPGPNADDDGIGIGVGIRVAVSDQVEINGGVTHISLDASGDETALNAAFLFNLNETFSIGVGGSFDDDVTSYSLNGCVYF